MHVRPTHRSTAIARSPLRVALLVAMLAALVSGFLTVVRGGTAEAAVTTPKCPRSTLVRSGTQTSAINARNDGATWNLRGTVFSARKVFPYPIRSEFWRNGCVVGAKVAGPIDRTATRDQWYGAQTHGGNNHEGFRLEVRPRSFALIRNVKVTDVEDAFDPNGGAVTSTTYIDHTRTQWIRDDCVENEDVVHNTVIRDSLWECFTVFAFRPSGSATKNGTADARLVVEDSLIHSRPQPLGSDYCSSSREDSGRCERIGKGKWLGAHGIWKWSRRAPKRVTIRDTIFRLDQPGYSSCSSQVWPDGTYENVTLVWTGKGRYSRAGGCSNSLPRGVRVTTDVTVWQRAKRAWLDGRSVATR